jgi:hypothetical protein
MRAVSVVVATLVALELSACSYTLSENDCATYRDRLEGWASAKATKPSAKPPAPSASPPPSASSAAPMAPAPSANGQPTPAEQFMKTCAGSTVTRGAHNCMERAHNEAEFFGCLE